MSILSVSIYAAYFLVIGIYFGLKLSQNLLIKNPAEIANRKILKIEAGLLTAWILIVFVHILYKYF
jgi:hypothetical protein